MGAALFVRVRAGSFSFDPFRLAVLCTLAILAFGNLHQMETERIWIYAVPWLAALALDRETLVSAALPWLLVVGWLQAYLMEIFLFTLW